MNERVAHRRKTRVQRIQELLRGELFGSSKHAPICPGVVIEKKLHLLRRHLDSSHFRIAAARRHGTLLLQPERVQNINGKLAHEIVSAANPRLGQHIVSAALPDTVLPGQPCVVQCPGREGPGIKRYLWPQFALSTVVSYKIPGDRMASAAPKTFAAAKVISRLIPQ